MLSIIVALAAAATAPNEPAHAYRDWVSVCDNTLDCQVTLGTGMPDSMDVQLTVSRGAAGRAMPVTSIYWPSGTPTQQALVTDGVRYPLRADGNFYVPVDRGANLRLARALANASTIEVVGDGKHVPISPTGASAAFRDMDARQRRVGTTTAIVAIGGKPSSVVARAPSRPTIVEMNPAHGPTMKPSKELLAQWREAEDCPAGNAKPGYVSWPVDAHTAAIIIACDSGGFRNANARIKVGSRPDGSDARSAEFDYDASMGDPPTATNEPINPELDQKTGRMESGERGGLANPGTYEEWVWDGHRFRAVLRDGTYGTEFRARIERRPVSTDGIRQRRSASPDEQPRKVSRPSAHTRAAMKWSN